MNSVAGENLDLVIKGDKVHIQTEDWGLTEKTLVSRIFKNGSVVKTFKLPYHKIEDSQNPAARRNALVQFHQYVVEHSQQQII